MWTINMGRPTGTPHSAIEFSDCRLVFEYVSAEFIHCSSSCGYNGHTTCAAFFKLHFLIIDSSPCGNHKQSIS